MTYLPRNFCKSDGCRPFGKFEWDPTITDSSIFLLLCKLLLCAFSSMLFLLCFYVQIPKGFYPSYPAISAVAIKDNNHQHAFVACSIFSNKLLVVKIKDKEPNPDSKFHLENTGRRQIIDADTTTIVVITAIQPEEPADPVEGERIFHSRMWVKGTPLHFIVDSGSQKNLISAEVFK
jgi:hypothetical protein